jgi:hypothetical protein
MTRRRVKGTGYKAASNPEAEPDLYALPFMSEVNKRLGEQQISQGSIQAVIESPVTSSPQYSPNFGMTKSAYITDATTDSSRASYSSSGEESDQDKNSPSPQSNIIMTNIAPPPVFSNQQQNQLTLSTILNSNNASMMANIAANVAPSTFDCFRTTMLQAESPQSNQGVTAQVVHSMPIPAIQQQTYNNNCLASSYSSGGVQQVNTQVNINAGTMDSPLLQGFCEDMAFAPLSLPTSPQASFAAPVANPVTNAGQIRQHHQVQQEEQNVLQEFADMWELGGL